MDILKILVKFYGINNVEAVTNKEGIYCCLKKTSDNKVYQVHFIDTTERWLDSQYSQLLEDVVIEKYYKYDNFLQWNFYYYIIADNELININIDRKKLVERNDEYTRKIVLTYEDYLEFIKSLSSIGKKSSDIISTDLYSLWVNELRSKELYFVYNYKKYPNYKQPVIDYINKLQMIDLDENTYNGDDSFSEIILNKIKILSLESFRDYPTKNLFEMGNVNLIYGVNAVGKTSFFDALELIITGEIKDKNINDNYNLFLLDEKGNKLSYPTTGSIYKRRDIEWYCSGSNRGNNLNNNFNKFNFYSSDASFQLKKDDDIGNNNLESIMTDIALGSEVNILEKRIKTIIERFSDYYDEYSIDLSNLEAKIVEKTDLLLELSNKKNDTNDYMYILLDTLSMNSWIEHINVNDQLFLSKLDNSISIVDKYISLIQNSNIPTNSISKVNVDARLTELEDKKSFISSIKFDLQKMHDQINNIKFNILEKKNLILHLNKLNDYYKNENFNFIFGLDDRIKENNFALEKANRIKQKADKVFPIDDALRIYMYDKSLKVIEEEFKCEIENLQNSSSNKENEINQFENGIEKLSSIISSIKSLGQEYLRLNPVSTYCPLCNSHFTQKKLSLAISETKELFNNSEILISLKNEIRNNKKRIELLKFNLKLINELKELGFEIFNSSSYDYSISDILIKVKNNADNLSTINNTYIKLFAINSQFKKLGLSEEKFNKIHNSIKDRLPFIIQNKDDLDKLVANLNEEINNLLNEENKILDYIKKDDIILKGFITPEINNEKDLQLMINLYQNIKTSFKQLDLYLTIEPKEEYSSLLKRINNIKSTFELFKRATFDINNRLQSIQNIESELEYINTDINMLKPKLKRVIFAKENLNNLLKKNNKIDYLNNYINSNRNEIINIFNYIHSPKEFESIGFEEDKITLISKNNEERSLSEISTGQRTALALSIFLSLNKKLEKGPNIIMFDDPVTYVDDLNILSFFDYLREIVVQTGRQVFFSTANADLAFLFKKKFEYLEDALAVHNLERNVN